MSLCVSIRRSRGTRRRVGTAVWSLRALWASCICTVTECRRTQTRLCSAWRMRRREGTSTLKATWRPATTTASSTPERPPWEKGAMHHSEAERYYREHCSVLFSMLKLVWLDSQSVRIRGHQCHSAAHRLSGGVHQEGHRYSHVLLRPLPSSGPRGPAEQRQSKNLLHTGTVDQIIMRLWGLGTLIWPHWHHMNRNWTMSQTELNNDNVIIHFNSFFCIEIEFVS